MIREQRSQLCVLHHHCNIIDETGGKAFYCSHFMVEVGEPLTREIYRTVIYTLNTILIIYLGQCHKIFQIRK
jgi:hypothetical protein